MRITDIFFLYHPCEGTGTVHLQPVIKHFDLNIGALDSIVAMRSGIHDDLRADKFTVLFFSDKNAIVSQIGFFLHLGLDIIHCLTNLIQYPSFKDHVLDDIHVFSNQCLNAIVADESNVGAWKELLGILAKKQDGSDRNLVFAIFDGNKAFVFTKIFFG